VIQRAKPNHRPAIRASVIAVLIAAGSSISAESVSFAADMPVKAPAYTKAPAALAAQNWSGFYIGGNVGEVQGHSTGTSDFLDGLQVGNNTFFSNPQRDSFSNMRVIGGLQGGYNWQFDPRWVVGVEADWDWTHSHYSFCRQTSVFSAACTDNNLGFENISGTTDWLATARARLGVTAGNFLLYGTGGPAWGRVDTTLTQNCLLGGCATSPKQLFASSTGSTTRSGWAAGLGAEAALDANWSVRAEWLHIDLGTVSSALTTPTGFTGFSETTLWSHTERYDQFRVGVNYKFAGWH
jgi:outer membrane immunogenic protein